MLLNAQGSKGSEELKAMADQFAKLPTESYLTLSPHKVRGFWLQTISLLNFCCTNFPPTPKTIKIKKKILFYSSVTTSLIHCGFCMLRKLRCTANTWVPIQFPKKQSYLKKTIPLMLPVSNGPFQKIPMIMASRVWSNTYMK